MFLTISNNKIVCAHGSLINLLIKEPGLDQIPALDGSQENFINSVDYIPITELQGGLNDFKLH